MSLWRGSLSGWFSGQTTAKSALVAAIIVSILGWGALLFGPTEANPPIGDGADAVVPDLVATVDTPSSLADQWLATARSELEQIPGITNTSVDWLSGGLTAFYLDVDDASVARRSLDTVTADVELVLAETAQVRSDAVDVSGRLAVEEGVLSSYGTSVTLLIMLGVIIGAALAIMVDWWIGSLVTISLVGSTLFSPMVARQIVGPFDGTLASTDVVSAFAAFVVAGLVCWRLLAWFHAPVGADGAELIRRSVGRCCSDIAVVGAGLVAVTGILAAFNLITSPLWGVLAGILLAGVWSGAITATGLATAAVGTRPQVWPDPMRATRPLFEGLRTLPSTPTTVLVGLASLALLAVFAFGQPGTNLIQQVGGGDDSNGSAPVDELYALGAGNPTEALVVTLNESSESTIDSVAMTIVPLSSVAWVDTATVRYIGADQQEAIEGVSFLSSSVVGWTDQPPEDLQRAAVIVPAVPLASEDGAQLVENVRSLDGVTVDSPALAGLTTRGSGRLTLVVAGLLALMSGLITFAVSSDRVYGVTTAVLGFLLGSAGAGLYRLVSGSVAAAELLSVLVMSVVVFLLWALAYTANGSVPDDASRLDDHPVNGEGVVATVGLAVVAALLVALSGFFGAGPGIGRFGLGTALVLAVVALAGMVVLGPALLGQSAVFHRLVRPVRSALHPDRPSSSVAASLADNPVYSKWTDVASKLVDADFRMQLDPAGYEADDVVLRGTPIHDEVHLRQDRMRQAGLRVSGGRPVVRRVDVVRDGRCPSVAMTIDHPERKLVSGDGTVVGVRRPERKSMVVWLASGDNGRFVIAESVETGTYPLDYVDVTRFDTGQSVVDLTDDSAMPTVGDGAM